MEVFGFDEFAEDVMKFERGANEADKEMNDVAEKMKNTARNNASAGGLHRTGAGIAGIQIEKGGDEVTIGWTDRPGLHLYFHELGFHALDNRRGRQRMSYSKGKRNYTGKKATYVPPTPHMRPAFEQHEQEFYRRVQQKFE